MKSCLVKSGPPPHGLAGHGGVFGLRLVKGRKRAAAAPAQQNDVFIAQFFFRMAYRIAQINGDFFHIQGRVHAAIAPVTGQHMNAVAHKFIHDGQPPRTANRVHGHKAGIGLRLGADKLAK